MKKKTKLNIIELYCIIYTQFQNDCGILYANVLNVYDILKCNHSSISIRLDNGRQRTPSQLVPGKNGGIIEERTRAQSRAGNALNAEDQYQVSY